MLMSNN